MYRMLLFALLFLIPTGLSSQEPGFVSLFDGKTLKGWTLVGGHGPGYIVEDGQIVCPAEGGGNLFTENEYANFVFRFEFLMEPGSNNGIGIRLLWRAMSPTRAWRSKSSTISTLATKDGSSPSSTTVRCTT